MSKSTLSLKNFKTKQQRVEDILMFREMLQSLSCRSFCCEEESCFSSVPKLQEQYNLNDNRKYEILYDITRTFADVTGPVTLHRIVALIDIPQYNVKKGDVGGWVQNKNNLSQSGLCWIKDDSIAAQNSRVFDDALIMNGAVLTDETLVCENAVLDGPVYLSGSASVAGSAYIAGPVDIENNASISGDALVIASTDKNIFISDFARVSGQAWLLHSVTASGYSIIEGYATLRDNVKVNGRAHLSGWVEASDNAVIGGDAVISSPVRLLSNARIMSPRDVAVMAPFLLPNAAAAVWKNTMGGKSVSFASFGISKPKIKSLIQKNQHKELSLKSYGLVETLTNLDSLFDGTFDPNLPHDPEWILTVLSAYDFTGSTLKTFSALLNMV